MFYLIDTNIVTALANRHPQALARLIGLPHECAVVTCFVVVGEWEYGIRNAFGHARQEAIRASGASAFAAFDAIWESSPEVSARYGVLLAEQRTVGRMIPSNDCWIAAVALVHGAVVVTADTHFRSIRGLAVEDWTE